VNKLKKATDRLRLLGVGSSDVDAMLKIWRMPDVRRFMCDDRIVDYDEALEYAKRSEESFRANAFGFWLLHLEEVAEPAGFAGFLPQADGTPELYYALSRDHWGKGLASEATRALIDSLFDEQQVPRIVAEVDEPNAASVRLLEGLRMAQTTSHVGAVHRILSFEMSSERWLSGRAR
jgi:ribosomal-protein-alanine N-acetyltransferase